MSQKDFEAGGFKMSVNEVLQKGVKRRVCEIKKTTWTPPAEATGAPLTAESTETAPKRRSRE